MSYGVSADSYCSRIRDLLDRNDESSLLYATLELRCAVEARMKEYLDPLDHIPKAHKKEYSVVKLGRTVDNVFPLKEQIALFTICFPNRGEEVTLRYVPVPKRLQDIAARAGDALHYPGDRNTDDPIWWSRLREMVEEGYEWFTYVAAGDLMGMPLLNRRTKQSILRIFMLDDDPRSPVLKRLAAGAQHIIRVGYEPLPKSPPRDSTQ